MAGTFSPRLASSRRPGGPELISSGARRGLPGQRIAPVEHGLPAKEGNACESGTTPMRDVRAPRPSALPCRRLEVPGTIRRARRAKGLAQALEQLEDGAPEAGRPGYQRKERPIRQALDPQSLSIRSDSVAGAGLEPATPAL